MTTQSTIDKLIEMRLTSMSDAFRIQMDDPKMKEISFEDRFGMLVDIGRRQILTRLDIKLPQPFESWSNSLSFTCDF